ncbi:hypothetical protein GGG16DRAFT_119606 [Schizophyllum commune]
MVRQNEMARQTELFIVITMYNEDEVLFCRTLYGVMGIAAMQVILGDGGTARARGAVARAGGGGASAGGGGASGGRWRGGG